MFFLLFYFTYGSTVYDFQNSTKSNVMTLFLNPLDIVEIKLEGNTGTFVGYWKNSDDLYLFVDADATYGPFDGDSGLAGIVFRSMNYAIRLVNDGIKEAQFSLAFSSSHYYPNIHDIHDFPIFEIVQNGDPIEELSSPFIYYMDKKGYKYIIIIMGIILGLLSLLISYMTFIEDKTLFD